MLVRHLIRSILWFGLCLIGCLTLAATAHTIRTYRNYTIDDQETIMNRRDTGLTLYDRTGHIFFTFDIARFKQFIPLRQIPLPVQQAIIAAEDRNFYHHHGLSLTGIARSLYLDLKHSQIFYGGSTITQQLVKNTYFTPEKSFTRKFNEAILAVKLERHFTKQAILEMYLNSAYFGHNVFGIEAAAHTYFNKGAAELTVSEASFLAGLLPAPSVLAPTLTPSDRALERQRYVLLTMQELGFVSLPERLAAELTPLRLNWQGTGINADAPHFALLVRDAIYQKFGRENAIRQGLHVTTTLDLTWQHQAESTLQTHVAQLATSGATNGAAVVLDPISGQVRALVGSVNWHTDSFGKINMAVSPRQTGSAIKPLVYAAALEEKIITPATILSDRPRTFGTNYRPQNFDGRFRGPVTARYALGNSLNVPAVEVASRVGLAKIVALAQKAGITSFANVAPTDLALALGAKEVSLLELVSAYGTFANSGQHQSPVIYTAIHDKQKALVPVSTAAPRFVVSPAVAWQITSILSDNVNRRPIFGHLLDMPFPAATKTGTTQNFRDAWAVGYTPTVAAGVWIGNSNNTPMNKVAGSIGAVPIWQDIMKFAAGELPPAAFVMPSSIIATKTCGRLEYYAPDNYPQKPTCPHLSPSPSPKAEIVLH